MPSLWGTSFYTATLAPNSCKCRRPIVDLGVYYRFKGLLMNQRWNLEFYTISLLLCVQLFCSLCNPLIPRYDFLLPFICPFSIGQGSLALHMLSYVVLEPLSNMTHLTHALRLTPLNRSILTEYPFRLSKLTAKITLFRLFIRSFYKVTLFSLTGLLSLSVQYLTKIITLLRL